MKVLIIGATGLVGSELVKHFSHSSEVQTITTLARRKLDPTLDHDKIAEISLPDLSPAKLNELTVEADVAICALGTTIKVAGSKENFRFVDLELVKSFGELVKRNHIKSLFVISAMGAKADSSIFYNRVKGEAEEALLFQDHSSLYLIRPSLLIGDRKEERKGEKFGISVVKCLEPFLPQSLNRMLGTKVSALVAFISKAIKDPQSGVHTIEAKDII